MRKAVSFLCIGSDPGGTDSLILPFPTLLVSSRCQGPALGQSPEGDIHGGRTAMVLGSGTGDSKQQSYGEETWDPLVFSV